MKKSVRNIIIMLVVLAALGGALAALLLWPDPSEQGEETSLSSGAEGSAAETVMDREAEDVASLSVENPEDSFVIVPDGDDFVLKGYEDYDLNTVTLLSSVNAVVSMEAVRNLGQVGDLAEYGLDGVGAATVTLEYGDGGSDTLVLGDNAAESSGRYVLKDGSVYIVSGVSEQLLGSRFAYFDAALYTIADRTETVTDDEGNETTQTIDDILYHLTLSGANFPETVEIGYGVEKRKEATYIITEPIKAESGSSTFSTIIEDLKGLTAADSVAGVGLDGETLARFGLDEPAAVAEFDMNNSKHTVSVSAPEGNSGLRYLLLDDRDVIYRVAGDKVNSWADATLMQLRLSYVWLPNILEVEDLTVTLDGDQVYDFGVTRTKNEEKSTETNTQYDLTVVDAAGNDVAYEDYQAFYKQLLAVAVLSTDPVEYGGTPALRAAYRYFDGGEDDVIEYYAISDGRYAATLNGQYCGQVRKSEVDKAVQALQDVQ